MLTAPVRRRTRWADDGQGHLGPLSIALSRALGTVMVTVHGNLDVAAARHLGIVLADIIDGQGNLDVVVDLHDVAIADGSELSVFAVAAGRATRRSEALSLTDPPDVLAQALDLMGLSPRPHHPPRRPTSVPVGTAR